MTLIPRSGALGTIGLVILQAALVLGAEGGSKDVIEIVSGTATFEVSTNMPGIEVKGKSTALAGQAAVVQDGNGLVLQSVDASVQVKSIATGMKLRDEHMRKYIFTTGDGQEPDLRFTSSGGTCPSGGATQQFTCQLSGSFTIRGVSRPVDIRLRVKHQGGSASAFHVEGDSIVKLSDFGIPAPSQFGVKPADEVKVHLEFVGKQKPSSVAAQQGGR